MTGKRPFVSTQFNPWDRKSYTYHWDGEPLGIGDKVAVDTKDGTATVTVVSLLLDPPSFPTKPIIRRAEAGQTS